MIVVFFLCGWNLWFVYLEYILGLIYIWIYKSEISDYGKNQKIMLTLLWSSVFIIFNIAIFDGAFPGYKF